jgi:autotransporter-associated beta strand protein
MKFSTKALLAALAVGAAAMPASADLYWKLDNTSGTWTSTNWGAAPAGPFTSGWTAGENAVFNADSTITYVTNTNVGNVTLADGVTVNVTTAGTYNTGGNVRTMNIGAGAVFNMAGQNLSTAAGTGFIKDGSGTWNMGANGNLYPAGFTLNAGTVIVSGNNTFGGGVLTINGGTIQSSGARTYAPSSIVLGGDFEITGTGGWTMNMPVGLGASTRTITNNATGTKTWNGVFSGGAGAGLTLGGTGTNVFTAANTFSGPLTISGGEQEFTSAGSLGTGTSIEVDGGRLALRGTFEVASSKNLGVGPVAEISTPGGSTAITYKGVIADKTATTGVVTKQGQGVLELGGASTYSGSTSINNGTIKLIDGNNRLPTGTVLNLGQATSTNLGTLDLNGFNQQVAGLNSTAGTNASVNKNTITSAAPAVLTVNGGGSYGDGNTTQNSGIIAGAISLVKSGAGTQTLGDANTYTGTTTITGGTLALGADGSIDNSTIIDVQTAGTFDVSAKSGYAVAAGQTLKGTGTVSGAVTIAGTLAPGASIGTLTFDDALTLAGTSNFEINSTTDTSDLVTGLTALTYGGTLNVTNLGVDYYEGQQFTLFSFDSYTGAFDEINLPSLPGLLVWKDFGGSTFDYDNGLIEVALIPEPGTLALAGLGLLMITRGRRRVA